MMRSTDLPILALVLAAGAAGGVAVPAAAQEVVQQLPDPAAAELAEAMRQLSADPQSLPALLMAADASVRLADLDAAAGFLSRAGLIAPDDGGVLAGQAALVLQQGDAVEALRLYAAAEAAGEPALAHAAQRGLAHDLVGDNATAQRFYRQALASNPDPEVVRRLALSQAIAGDGAAAETTLMPLLQRQDRAAYRTRAFALAILGQEEEALAISEAMLPARVATRLAPYLTYMPRLTRAQQAAAANLGRFPPAAQIGRDDPRLAGIGSAAGAEPAPAQVVVASIDERLIPGGEPFVAAAEPAPAPVAPPPPVATEPVAPEPVVTELPALAGPVAEPAPVARVVVQPLPQPVPATEPPLVIAAIEPPPAPVAAPVPAPPPQPAPPAPPLDLAEAFADLRAAETTPRASVASGAVDITSITPRRERPAPPPPPPLPATTTAASGAALGAAGHRAGFVRLPV